MYFSVPDRRRGAVAAAGLLLLLAPAASYARGAREETTREFSRVVPMRSGQGLRLDHEQGDVAVRTHALSEVRIAAHIRVSAPSAGEAAAAVQQVTIDVQETPDAVAVRTRYPDGRGRDVSYAVDYEITMPEGAPLQARNSFGAFTVVGLKADGHVRNSHGRLSFTDGKGRQRLENAFGAVDVSRNEGDVTIANQNGAVKVSGVQGALEVSNRFGSVEVRSVRGAVVVVGSNGTVLVADAGGPSRITNSFGAVEASLVRGDLTVVNANGNVTVRTVSGTADLKTSFGAVEASQVQGEARVTNSNGGVTLRDAAGAAFLRSTFGLVQAERVGGSLQVENSNGAVRATAVKGSATVRTSFGAVVLSGVEGPVVEVRNQNGAVEVDAAAARCTRIDLSTSFSAIRLRLPPAGGYDVSARTSFGSIQSELPITASGKLGGDSLSGRIGAGGCPVTLTDNNGSIEILKAVR